MPCFLRSRENPAARSQGKTKLLVSTESLHLILSGLSSFSQDRLLISSCVRLLRSADAARTTPENTELSTEYLSDSTSSLPLRSADAAHVAADLRAAARALEVEVQHELPLLGGPRGHAAPEDPAPHGSSRLAS